MSIRERGAGRGSGMSGELTQTNAYERRLATTEDLGELKRGSDELEALRQYAKRAGAKLPAQNKIAFERLRWLRKAGAILRETVRDPAEGRPRKASRDGTLRELGFNRNQSSRWQMIASLTDDEFREYAEWCNSEEAELTLVGLYMKAKLGPHYSSDTPEWYTPDELVAKVVEVLGRIDLDPCADPDHHVPAKAHYTQKQDGLSHPWAGKVYMNPPYGRELPCWVEKLCNEYTDGDVTEAIALVPARTDTGWFKALRDFPRCFVWGRLKFSESENSAPFPSMVVYLGPNPDRFAEVFSELGDVYELRAA